MGTQTGTQAIKGSTVLHDADELTLAYSPNFDRTGWIMDKNVVFPIDRLNEMADEGIIGSVAETHLSLWERNQIIRLKRSV